MNKQMRRQILMFFVGLFIIQSQDIQPVSVGFVHPGQMINIPTSESFRSPYLFRMGLTGELVQFDPETFWRKGIHFETDITDKLRFGLTLVSPQPMEGKGGSADTTRIQTGVHIQYRIYTNDRFSISAGVHDLIVQSSPLQNLTGLAKEVAPFLVLSQINEFENHHIHSYMGIGSGRFRRDSVNETDLGTVKSPVWLFMGLLMRTHSHNGKKIWDFIAEYDGGGINIGAKIPILENFSISAGFVNVESLPGAAEHDFDPWDKPALTLGLNIDFPRLKTEKKGYTLPHSPLTTGLNFGGNQEKDQKDTTLYGAAYGKIISLRDSLKWRGADLSNMKNSVARYQRQADIYTDSIRTIKLSLIGYEENLNKALQYLYKSLLFYTKKDYSRALEMADKAIEFNPNIAMAYARRGSIYYEAGDIGRAALNWQIALKIDPEFKEVRESLTRLREMQNSKNAQPK